VSSEQTRFDFDPVIDRQPFHSLKWERYRGRDVLPLWVADMDFAVPPAVTRALAAQVEHGIFGYTLPSPTLTAATVAYLQRHYDWTVEASSIVWLGGLVSGLNLAVRAGSAPGDGVAVFSPIYPPFLSAPGLQERRAVVLPLVAEAMHYRIDFAALEAAFAAGVRLLLFCHPHNPVGRVWEDAELTRLAELLVRYDVVVCSDDIHCDLILDADRRHRPLALWPGIAPRSITLMGPGKTFNIAGLGLAYAIIPDAALRRRFRAAMQGLVPHPCGIAYAALEACLNEGEPWRQALLDYLRGNRERVATALAAMGLPATPVQATFLSWFDARGIPDAHRLFEQHGVGLSDGEAFGTPGFLRLNFGCPRATLDEALARMQRALASL